jgi:7-cyano-7-deazaguanine synthase
VKESVILLSGGLDSATLAYHLKSKGHSLLAVYTDLGMHHSKRELASVEHIANLLRIPLKIVSYTGMSGLIGAFGNPGYIDGGDTHDPEPWPDIKAEFQSTASAIFNTISPALYIARAVGIKEVSLGFVAEDIENRPRVEESLNLLADSLALLDTTRSRSGKRISFSVPFAKKTKAEVAQLGTQLGVPIESTYSCIQGRPLHCGVCSTCVKRKDAIRIAGIRDPSWYEESPNVPMRKAARKKHPSSKP